MVKIAIVAAVIVGVSAPIRVSAAPAETISTANVAELERTLTLPRGARPLADYARYYTAETLHHRAMLRGYFVLDGPDKPGSYLRDSPVTVADGGCSVVTVYFDLKKRRLAGVFCNGFA